MNICFALRIERSQDASVLSEDVVDITDIVGRIAIEPIVMCRSTVRRTEDLVRSSLELLSTLPAYPCHRKK